MKGESKKKKERRICIVRKQGEREERERARERKSRIREGGKADAEDRDAEEGTRACKPSDRLPHNVSAVSCCLPHRSQCNGHRAHAGSCPEGINYFLALNTTKDLPRSAAEELCIHAVINPGGKFHIAVFALRKIGFFVESDQNFFYFFSWKFTCFPQGFNDGFSMN